MRPVRVKICGITRREDAEAAVRLGADALGFVFWPKSPRVVDIAAARAISIAVPALVARVGVFVDASPDDVTSVVKQVGLDAVQLHGSEDVNAYRAVPARLIKAVTLESDADVERAASLPSHVTVLVDATDPVQRGGTGKAADWSRAAMLAAKRPILLAGGLSAENVGDAMDAVRPWGLDVSSGVESAPGVKHLGKLTMLFAAVRPETSAIGHRD